MHLRGAWPAGDTSILLGDEVLLDDRNKGRSSKEGHKTDDQPLANDFFLAANAHLLLGRSPA